MGVTYLAIAAGELAEVTGDVERLLGRAPLSLEQVLADGSLRLSATWAVRGRGISPPGRAVASGCW